MNKRAKIEPATTVVTSFDVRSRNARVGFVLGAAGAYILMFLTLYSRMGPGLAALSGLPVIAAGWLLGLRVGLVVWLLFLPVNTLLFNMVDLLGWDTVFRNGGGPGTLVTIIIVVVAGRLRDLREQLKREIIECTQAEEALKRANDHLDDRVKQQSAELQDANKRLEKDLTERNWLTRIYREAPVGLCCFDTQLRYLDINEWLAALNGLSVEEHIGRSVSELFPELAAGIESQLRKVIETGEPILEGSIFAETLAQPRVKRYFHHNYDAVKSDDGTVVGVSCAVVEITERKRAEEALQKAHDELEQQVEQRTLQLQTANAQLLSEIEERKATEESLQANQRRLQLSLNATRTSCWEVNFKTGELLSQGPTVTWLGDDPDEVPTSREWWKSLIHPDDVEIPENALQDYLEGRAPTYECEYRVRGKSSEWYWTLDRGMVVQHDTDGTPLLIAGTESDITERKLAEKALQERIERYELVAEGANDAIWDWDVLNHRVYLSPRWKELLGLAPNEVSDSEEEWSSRIHPDDTLRVMAVLQAHLEGKTEFFQEEYRIRCKDGSFKWVLSRGLAQRDAVGNVVRMAGSDSDITERKQAEEVLRDSKRRLEQTLAKLEETQEQVIQQERLRALGQMAGGVAHDLNNSLSPVLGYAEMLASAPDLPEKLRQWSLLVEMGARDAAAVVERLGEFYRPQNPQETGYETVNLRELMAQILQLTRPKWRDEAQRTGRNIEFELDLEGEPLVNGTPAELREVLTNLVFNSVDAMPSGGKITLRLHSAAEFAVIEVIDTGIGMTVDVAGRCFEPFFTAKGAEGTGLGLSVCHGIVQRVGGRFEIDTQPGHGTTMRIFLPLALQDELAEPEERIADVLPSRRVLYIDDDPRLRQLVSTLLEQLGQQVDLADGGPTGLEMVRANDYDIVITDLGMPEIDGREVTRIVKTIRQNMPVIMVTGWGSHLRQERFDGAVEPDQLVAKPLTLTKLREALEKAFA